VFEKYVINKNANRKGNRIKAKMIFTARLVTAMVLFMGCGDSKLVKTAFLSDYSKRLRESDTTMRYIDDEAALKYSAFNGI